ncbi:hypothetical protein [Streptosporangium sandarakinum]|uniref:hypothetical protein n=1 Tax=Streptosporangium sandarakinum TaxID=1260955 RepID=UPI003723AD41
MPYAPDPGDPAERLAFAGLREARHTIIRLIGAHLREDAATSWQGHDFDFTGVVFGGGDFSRATFSGGTTWRPARPGPWLRAMAAALT